MFPVGAKKNLNFYVCCLFAEIHADLSGIAFLAHIRIVTKETYTKKVMVCKVLHGICTSICSLTTSLKPADS